MIVKGGIKVPPADYVIEAAGDVGVLLDDSTITPVTVGGVVFVSIPQGVDEKQLADAAVASWLMKLRGDVILMTTF